MRAAVTGVPDFRPRRWPFRVAVALNLLLALLFLGWPYVRGRSRTEDARRRFAVATACIVGGEAASAPGVVLPERIWSDYAKQVEEHPQGWPARCVPLLDAVAPAQTRLLLPAVKGAEATLREAVARAQRELEALTPPLPPGARVPSRPLEALERVAAALTILSREAGATDGLDHTVISEAGPMPVTPTRLPLDADNDAELWVSASAEGFGVVGVGRRRVGWTRAEGGHVRADGAHRPGSLRAVSADGAAFSFLWATSPERCVESADGCRQRALGISRGDYTATELSEPSWLAGHPAFDFDASVRLRGHEGVEMLALGPETTPLVWRSFALRRDADGPEVRPAAREQPLPNASRAALLADGAVLVLGETQAWLWRDGGECDSLGTVPPHVLGLEPQPGGGACLWTADRVLWLDSLDGRLRRRAAPPGAAFPLLRALHVGDEQGSTTLLRDTAGTLWSTRGLDSEWRRLAAGVQSFSAVQTRGRGLVAFVQVNGGAARVVGLEGSLPIRSPAACFDRRGGFCGQATLAAAGDRILLVVHDGGDVLALETQDGGDTFTPARGL